MVVGSVPVLHLSCLAINTGRGFLILEDQKGRDIYTGRLCGKCQDIDNPEFGSECVNTSITRFKVQGTKREATGRVSRAPVPRQSKLGCGARE